MIKANELRIGNLVGYNQAEKTDPTYHLVIRIEESTARLYKCPVSDGLLVSDIEYIDLSGIPLTPEWLERCGFEDGKIRPSYKLHMAIRPYQTLIQGVFPGEWQVTLLNDIPHALSQSIKYLHQLQNLYFALTGEELTITL